MRPSGYDIRNRIIAAKLRGEKREAIALWLGVSVSTVDKVWKLFLTTGSILPKPYKGRTSMFDEETERKLIEAIKNSPDATLQELIDELSLPITVSGLWRKLDKMGISFKKKTFFPSKQNEPEVMEERKVWAENQPNLDVNELIFLDESGIDLGMTRLYGRAPTNERVIDYVPDVRYDRVSIVSTVRLNGTQVPFVFEGTLNAPLFSAYLKKFVVPTLSKGDIVVMDNSSVHTAKGAIDPIINAGAKVLFLPRYSPDFNPIELLWSKMKSFLRKAKARTFDALMDAIKEALDSITLKDIESWFKNDGYAVVSL